VLLDISPLRRHRDFRFVFAGQLVSGRFSAMRARGSWPSALGFARSITRGGLLCVAGVVACVPTLPAFWRYRKLEVNERENSEAP
jgi:hypothetical protein